MQKDAGHNGVSTDEKGCFRLTLPSGRTSVVVSCMGMKKQTIEVNNQSTFDIYLEPEVNDIAATVVTGYMPKAKNSFTGTAVLVKGDELRTVNNNSFFDALKVFEPVVSGRGRARDVRFRPQLYPRTDRNPRTEQLFPRSRAHAENR